MEKKLRATVCADGRVGFPEVLEYLASDGKTSLCPPRGVSYRLVIKDLETYEELARGGYLGSGHLYRRWVPAIDNRRTTV